MMNIFVVTKKTKTNPEVSVWIRILPITPIRADSDPQHWYKLISKMFYIMRRGREIKLTGQEEREENKIKLSYCFFVCAQVTVLRPGFFLYFFYIIWQDAGKRTRVAATADRCATNELHTSLIVLNLPTTSDPTMFFRPNYCGNFSN